MRHEQSDRNSSQPTPEPREKQRAGAAPVAGSAHRTTGISNRESADEEQAERDAHPPLNRASREPDGGPVDEQMLAGASQTSHKAGSRSVARKESESRYPDKATPASRKVAGAFGAEPHDEPAE